MGASTVRSIGLDPPRVYSVNFKNGFHSRWRGQRIKWVDEQSWEMQAELNFITRDETTVHLTHIDARHLRQSSTVHALSITMMSSQTSESLLKRLAGPSTGKAGLAKDQTEINRIIGEASKGSRFYEVGLTSHESTDATFELLVVQNEKRKDKDLTERIGKLLKRRDEVTKSVDLGERHNVTFCLPGC